MPNARNIHIEILKEEERDSSLIFDVQVIVLEGSKSLKEQKVSLFHNGENLGWFPLDENNHYVHRRLEVPKGVHSFQAVDEFRNHSAVVRSSQADKTSKSSTTPLVPTDLKVEVLVKPDGGTILEVDLFWKEETRRKAVGKYPIRIVDPLVPREAWSFETDEDGAFTHEIQPPQEERQIEVFVPGTELSFRTVVFPPFVRDKKK